MIWQLCPMELDDLEQVLDIEQHSFSSPWTPDLFVNEFVNPISRRLVALDPRVLPARRVAGYLIYWEVVADEFHLMSIAVHQGCRRRGVGAALLESMIGDIRKPGTRIVLEVRVGNLGAQQLYRRYGFTPVGIRPHYYQDTDEDALLMERVAPPEAGP